MPLLDHYVLLIAACEVRLSSHQKSPIYYLFLRCSPQSAAAVKSTSLDEFSAVSAES